MSLLYRKDPHDKRGKWIDVFKSLLLIIVCYMGFRWILWEPFVIPSGSMETSLLVQDYVLVKKWAYGLRLPFSEKWIVGPNAPDRGDIVVFKAVDQSGNFLVKRVIGLPGDEIRINEKGFIQINDEPFVYQEIEESQSLSESDRHIDWEFFNVYWEDNGQKRYKVQYAKGVSQGPQQFTVPEGHLFMMGDNRNHSMDSRYWGALPLDRIMGKLVMIWISCEESESYSSFLCSPKDFRTDRLFKFVD